MTGTEREARDRGARKISLAASHASRKEAAPAFSTGINPLFGSEVAPTSFSGDDSNGTLKPQRSSSPSPSGRTPPATAATTTNPAAAAGPATKAVAAALMAKQHQRQRSSESTSMARRKRGTSPQSTLTTSTTQSDSSRRVRTASVAPSPQVALSGKTPNSSRSAPVSRNGSINKGISSDKRDDFIPAPLVPALLAPVPPPPPKRRSVTDIETGDGGQSVSVGEELGDAPDKTLMEMLQTYLKKQDLYTRMVLVVLLLVLAGGVLGAYALMVWYAIDRKEPKYIVVVSLISVVFGWVLWRYCFSGDQMLQDQSQIAQDIATLYAAMPDHTAAKGVSDKGRAQFTDFKYEKSEMMFTAVTDDGVSLGSERGSELMMDGADPSCPLCNKAYVEGAELSLLPCLHVFHKTCINKWCDRHIVCPLCKRHLEAAEPLHTLTAAYNHHHHHGGAMAQSEPGGGHRGYGNTNPRNQWRGVMGAAAPGPASAQGSERGLGGTRSEDGMWNDRVLNAAQLQMGGKTHARVTSFSAETRRANSARSRDGQQQRGGAGGGRGGPPHSSSTGQRSHSVSGSSGWHHHHQLQQQQQQQQLGGRLQRKRSSSFNTASEHRGRNGSGRVAQGTAPHRGSAGVGFHRGDLCTSPRSRSDLGVGSRDADLLRAHSDAMLSLHAGRRSNGAGGMRVRSSSDAVPGDDGGSGADESKDGRTREPMDGARQQGPAVITVRRVEGGKTSGGTGSTGTRAQWRDMARSGGESESEIVGGERERVFATNGGGGGGGGGSRRAAYNDDDSDEDDVTTKALTYGPRKPKVSKDKARDGSGHRRQSSTGSNSSGGGGSSRKPRRRPSVPGSKSGSGTLSAVAAAASTAEAVSKLLSRSSQDDRGTTALNSRGSANPRGGGGGGGGRGRGGISKRSSGGGASDHGFSDSDGGSDARLPGRRNSRGSGGPILSVRSSDSGIRSMQLTQPQPQPHQHQQQQLKATPTKTGSVTKGTPAPPMAAARVATWNSNASGLAPVPDASHAVSTGEHEGGAAGTAAAGGAAAVGTARRAGAAAHETAAAAAVGGGGGRGTTGSSPSTEKKGSGRGWNFRIPSSAGSAEFFGFGGTSGGATRHNGSGNTVSSATTPMDATGDAGEWEKEGHGGGGGSSSARASLTSRVFSRGASSVKMGPSAATRLFGSTSAAAQTGVSPMTGAESGVDSADDEGNAARTASSSSVRQLIQTYEKSKAADENNLASSQEWHLLSPTAAGGGEKSTKVFTKRNSRRRGSRTSATDDGGNVPTESEADDDDHIERPKLSYKKKKKKSSTRGTRPAADAGSDADGPRQHTLHAVHRGPLHVGSAVDGGGDAAGWVGEGTQDYSDHDVHHGRQSWGELDREEEPYERPKLSYRGGGLRSSSSTAPASFSR